MDDIGHSRLLKLLVGDNKLTKMEAPVFKIDYENITPTNIESEVPGKQNIREADEENATQDSTVALDNKIENPDDYVLSPVITVTKQETEFTKGDLKLQKVSVTEDISEDREVYYTKNSNPNIYAEVITTQPVRVIEENKTRTKIPTLKFRQAADAVRKRGVNDKKDEVIHPRLLQKRSSIPRLKESRIPPPLDRRSSKTDIKVETPQPEDEFEKIYDEIVTEPKEINIDTIESVKVEDPEKLEHTFEEIIHDYEENKVHPITVDVSVDAAKPKSRIPLSKRKSEHEIKIPKPIERTVIKKDEPISEKIDTRIPVHKDLPYKAIRTKYNIRNEDKLNGVHKIATNKSELIENPKEEDMKHKILHIEPVKREKREVIEIKINDSLTKEDNGLTSSQVQETVENPIRSYTESETTPEPVLQENTVVVEHIVTEPNKIINDTKPIETEIEICKANGIPPMRENKIDSNDVENTNMDTEYKPGKVSRLLQRIRSQEFATDKIAHKKEILVEVPKKKSVLSKIAMFERQDSAEDLKSRPRINSPVVKSKQVKTEILREDLVDKTPIIVDELLKERNIEFIEDNNTIEYSSAENSDNSKKDYTVEIETDKVKFREVVEVYPEDAKINIEDNISSLVINNQILLGKEPNDITNKVDITKHVSKELLEPPAETLDEKVPSEIVIETLEHNSTEYKIKDSISIEEKFFHNIEQNNSDISKYEHDNFDNKEDISIDNITVDETKIETLEFHPMEYENKVENGNDVFTKESKLEKWKSQYLNGEIKRERPKSVAEVDLGDVVKGRVHQMIVRMNSFEKTENKKTEIVPKERPRKKSVSKIIALFEQKSVQYESPTTHKAELSTKSTTKPVTLSEEEYQRKIAELVNGRVVHGRVENMTYIVLNNGVEMPVLAVGTAALDKKIIRPVIEAAIDMGYRAIDSAYIYGNEKEVGEAIRAKIDDGTVARSDLFIISKLWSTSHRPDLVAKACRASLQAMGLQYFDLYLIHNPMSFKEGIDPIPKIANVVQYSSSDFMDAWYGLEGLAAEGLVKSLGLSNFNSRQIQRVLDKAKVKPVINQVECHPYLSQQQLDAFCSARDIKLSCFGVLGSKGTPKDLTSGLEAVIDDPLVQVMAAGLNISAAQLLIRYQIDSGHNVVVKASSAAHLWDNLQALQVSLDPGQVKALHALNRNKRIYTFVGMGDTHRNYPFKIPF